MAAKRREAADWLVERAAPAAKARFTSRGLAAARLRRERGDERFADGIVDLVDDPAWNAIIGSG